MSLSFIQHYIQARKEDIIKAIIGGALMSFSSSLNLLLTGRITGFSNICYKAFTAPSESSFRWGTILGLVVVSSSYTYLYGTQDHDSARQFLGDISIPLFLFSAFLVGFGTKLANGCTSGHGVCGLPRLSRRSIAAVLTFLSFGILTATIRSKYPFEDNGNLYYMGIAYALQLEYIFVVVMCVSAFSILGLLFYQTMYKQSVEKTKDCLISVLVGVIFGLGLIISGMVKKTKVLGFLVLNENWDPSLMFVLFTAVGLNLLTFNFIIRAVKKPWIVNFCLDLPTLTNIDLKLILGATTFGIGWGLSGLCPGPVLINLHIYIPHLLVFLVVLVIGQKVGESFGDFLDRNKLKSL